MDILITVFCLERASSPFISYYLEAAFNLGKFQSCENPGFLICSREGNTSVNVLAPKPGIIGQGFVVLNEERILAA